MNVGLYFDLRNPRAWRQDPHRLYADTLELCEEADRRGIHSLWFTEHHLFDDDYLPQPLTYMAAVAARTKQARLGTSILLAPLHAAVTVAEQCAIVDLVSNGRVDLGLGAGYRLREFELFGVAGEYDRRGLATVERALEVRRLCDEGGITPAPVQRPFPIWVGASFRSTARRVGRAGFGLKRLDRFLREPYLEGLEEGGHGRDAARIAGPANILLSDDPERTWAVVREHVRYQWDSYARHGVEGTGRAWTPTDPDEWRARGMAAGATRGFELLTPEDAAARIRECFAGPAAETVYVWATIAGLPAGLARRNVELVLDGLVPLLRDPL